MPSIALPITNSDRPRKFGSPSSERKRPAAPRPMTGAASARSARRAARDQWARVDLVLVPQFQPAGFQRFGDASTGALGGLVGGQEPGDAGAQALGAERRGRLGCITSPSSWPSWRIAATIGDAAGPSTRTSPSNDFAARQVSTRLASIPSGRQPQHHQVDVLLGKPGIQLARIPAFAVSRPSSSSASTRNVGTCCLPSSTQTLGMSWRRPNATFNLRRCFDF